MDLQTGALLARSAATDSYGANELKSSQKEESKNKKAPLQAIKTKWS